MATVLGHIYNTLLSRLLEQLFPFPSLCILSGVVDERSLPNNVTFKES